MDSVASFDVSVRKRVKRHTLFGTGSQLKRAHAFHIGRIITKIGETARGSSNRAPFRVAHLRLPALKGGTQAQNAWRWRSKKWEVPSAIVKSSYEKIGSFLPTVAIKSSSVIETSLIFSCSRKRASFLLSSSVSNAKCGPLLRLMICLAKYARSGLKIGIQRKQNPNVAVCSGFPPEWVFGCQFLLAIRQNQHRK